MADRPQPSNVLWSQTLPLELVDSPHELTSPIDHETIGDDTPEEYVTTQVRRAHTLDEVAATFDKPVTKERVRQIEAMALRKFCRHWRNMIGSDIGEQEAIALIYQATAYEAAKGEVECKR